MQYKILARPKRCGLTVISFNHQVDEMTDRLREDQRRCVIIRRDIQSWPATAAKKSTNILEASRIDREATHRGVCLRIAQKVATQLQR
jgi:branched-subunit amino acid aminotransferase/4-amino-4-deoxychorismate lyase